jgi:hypothetical protein
MNCCADMGVPSGCQNVVAIMCWMLRSFPSASFTFTLRFFSHTQGSSPQISQTSLEQMHGLWSHTAQDFGGVLSQTQKKS